MTEKQFIKMLKNIKEYCIKTSCFNNDKKCVFRKDACQLQVLARRLYDLPANWDIEKIEELINE